MATQNAQNTDLNSPETRLMRFLFVGKERPYFQTGNWEVHKYYLPKNVPSVEELAGNPEKSLIPIETVKKAHESQSVPNPDTLVFVLALCAKQSKSETLRNAAYKAVSQICVSPERFLLFVKFSNQLSKMKSINNDGQVSSSGWGHGMKKAVNNWYLSKDPLELIKCMTRFKSRHGWKHKDVIKLSHLQPSTQESNIIFKYTMNGSNCLNEAQTMFPNNEKVQQIIEYIQHLEDFKHCEDEVQSAGLLEKYNLTLEDVPGHMLKSEEIWNSLIPAMDTTNLLNHLQRIHNLGMLKQNAPAVGKIVDQFTDNTIISRDKPHPALVLITIRNYEHSGKPLSYEKRKIKEQAKKVLPHPPKPNDKIVRALYQLLNHSFNNLKPTGLRYMVTINVNKPMLETNAWHCSNLSGAEVGCIIALSLFRSEKDVSVATFKHMGVQIVRFEKNCSFEQAMDKLQPTAVQHVDLGKPMLRAIACEQEYDVFINITDRMVEKLDKSYKNFETYKTKMKLPNTRLINCAICASSVYENKNYDNNILTICGFDASVPMIIEAFAKSLF